MFTDQGLRLPWHLLSKAKDIMIDQCLTERASAICSCCASGLYIVILNLSLLWLGMSIALLLVSCFDIQFLKNLFQRKT